MVYEQHSHKWFIYASKPSAACIHFCFGRNKTALLEMKNIIMYEKLFNRNISKMMKIIHS